MAEIKINPQGIKQAVSAAIMDAANLHIITEECGIKHISSNKQGWCDQYMAWQKAITKRPISKYSNAPTTAEKLIGWIYGDHAIYVLKIRKKTNARRM